MPKNVRGITVEIGGDTTKLGKALKDTEQQTKSVQKELKLVNTALKFNPANLELITQKQRLLTQEIDLTSDKLDKLKAATHDSFRLKYNENLQLFTIRHYQPGLEKTFTQGKKIYVEQSSRSTLQMVLK